MAQTIPFGPQYVADNSDIVTRSGYPLTTAATQVQMSTIFNAGYCRRVVVANTTASAVSIAVRRQYDDPSVMTVYTIPPGIVDRIDGHITAVGGTDFGSTSGVTVQLEL